MNQYNSIIVAKYMLALANARGIALNATQVQKLLYILYGLFLAKEGRVILDEAPKAWPFGPVFPKTQKKVKCNDVPPLDSPELREVQADRILTEKLNYVIDRYSRFSAGKLSEWSHAPGGPWEKTTKLPSFNWNAIIPDEYISEYFNKINI